MQNHPCTLVPDIHLETKATPGKSRSLCSKQEEMVKTAWSKESMRPLHHGQRMKVDAKMPLAKPYKLSAPSTVAVWPISQSFRVLKIKQVCFWQILNLYGRSWRKDQWKQIGRAHV